MEKYWQEEEDLHLKYEKALGPAQKLIILKQLINLYKLEESSLKINKVFLSTLRTSLEISNADPELWHDFGEVAMKLDRIPLALYAFQSACKLSSEPGYLHSYAKVLALTHDYINSLAICNYLIDTFAYDPACSIRDYVKARLTGSLNTSMELYKVPIRSEVDKEVTPSKKIWNLYSLCVAVRQVASNKDGTLYKYERSDPGAAKKKKSDKYVAPECKYWEIIEQYKLKILESTGSACFGFIPERIYRPNFISSKVTARFEPEIAKFIQTEMNYRKISADLIGFLCKNNPRPSTLLSAEVSSEILKLYALTKDSLSLEDEYLTLLEIAINEAPELINELRVKMIASYKQRPELNLRVYFALASAYYKTRELFEKTPESLAQLLFNAYSYANKAGELVQNETVYLWWSDLFISKKEVNSLIEEISVDWECMELEKVIKGGTRLAQSALVLLDKITKIMLGSYKNDDPQFYWKKMKIILKNLAKFQLTPEQNLSFAQCLARYVAVLLYVVENGGKVNTDHDIKGLLFMLTDNINYSILPPETMSQLVVSTINLLRHCSKNIQQIPFFFKKVFKDIQPDFLPTIFYDFHKIIDKKEVKYHLSLCKEFEKSCFAYNSDGKEIIFKWLYGLSTKKCLCDAKFPQAPVVLPNSSNKLMRLVSFLFVSLCSIESFKPDSLVLNFFNELFGKEPKFFVTCQVKQSKKVEELMNTEDFHGNCCLESVRTTAIQGYKRFAIELIGTAKVKEVKEVAKYLRTTVDVLSLALSLDPSDCELWALLGYAYMWKWILLYYDLLNTIEPPADITEQVDLAIASFEKANKTSDPQLKNFINENKAILLYSLCQVDKSKRLSSLSHFSLSDSPTSLAIKLMILDKLNQTKFEPEFFNQIKLKHPILTKLKYLQFSLEGDLKKLQEATDIFSKYYEGKIMGNWIEIFENDFLTLDLPCPNLKIHRHPELWKMRRKIAEKALKMCEKNENDGKIKEIIAKYSSNCVRSKKNREALRVVYTGFRILALSMEKFDVAKEEIDRNPLLNSKEKQSLKVELGLITS